MGRCPSGTQWRYSVQCKSFNRKFSIRYYKNCKMQDHLLVLRYLNWWLTAQLLVCFVSKLKMIPCCEVVQKPRKNILNSLQDSPCCRRLSQNKLDPQQTAHHPSISSYCLSTRSSFITTHPQPTQSHDTLLLTNTENSLRANTRSLHIPWYTSPHEWQQCSASKLSI